MKFKWSGYWKPTPKKIRKIADAIVAAATFSGSAVVLNGHPLIGTIIFVLGFIAKVASNFFQEDEPVKKSRNAK
jgi:hypothetical protein